MPRLRAEHLYKLFGRRPQQGLRQLKEGRSRDDLRNAGIVPAVVDASFTVEAGEIFVVMGLSGSGKSTLVRMLNGLLEPTAGEVFIDDTKLTGLDIKSLRQLRSTRVSMVFQHFALLPHRSVLENAAYGLSIRRVRDPERTERATNALELVGLDGWADSMPSELSGGMQQRVGLARALATDADILLMDEAFSALDPLIRREMQDQLIELQRTLQKTIIFITHDLNEAMRLGDRIAVMRAGEIVQIGTGEDVLLDPANDYVAKFTQDVDRSRFLTASSAMVTPATSILVHEGPHVAAMRMRELQASALFVVGRDRRLIGAVRDEVVSDAVRRGITRLDEIVETEVAQISPDTPLADLFAPAATARLPLAVVDDQHRLLGAIPRVTLLGALGGVEPNLELDAAALSQIPATVDGIARYHVNEVDDVGA